jgi:NitT/TauT family transport system substrate-binding protein
MGVRRIRVAALAAWLYRKAGLDVPFKTGGPQINGMQLLVVGQAAAVFGYDIAVMKGCEQRFDAVTIAASFQKDLQAMMTHADVPSLAGLKDKTILIATSGRTSWWPWLKARCVLRDAQARPYTFDIQPFPADPDVAQPGYPPSEPSAAAKAGMQVNFFLFADDGYPTYGTTIVTMARLVAERPEVLKKLVAASIEGWKSLMQNPAPAIAFTKRDSPAMTDDTIASRSSA